jgi:tRNA modification GTPase
VLFLHDLTRADLADYAAADAEILADLAEKLPASVPVLDVWNKQDAAPTAAHRPAACGCRPRPAWGSRHCAAAAGHRRLAGRARGRVHRARAPRAGAGARRRHLAWPPAHLAAQAQLLDLLAEELRLAQNALNEITGEFTADDLLGVIFSRFCIGK